MSLCSKGLTIYKKAMAALQPSREYIKLISSANTLWIQIYKANDAVNAASLEHPNGLRGGSSFRNDNSSERLAVGLGLGEGLVLDLGGGDLVDSVGLASFVGHVDGVARDGESGECDEDS